MDQDRTTIAHALVGEATGDEDVGEFVKRSVPAVFYDNVVRGIKVAINNAGYHAGTLQYTAVRTHVDHREYQDYSLVLHVKLPGVMAKLMGSKEYVNALNRHLDKLKHVVVAVLDEYKHEKDWSRTLVYTYYEHNVPRGTEMTLETTGDMRFPLCAEAPYHVVVDL